MKRLYNANKDNNKGYYLKDTVGDGVDSKSSVVVSEKEKLERDFDMTYHNVKYLLDGQYKNTFKKTYKEEGMDSLLKKINEDVIECMYKEVLKAIELNNKIQGVE